MSGGVIVLEEEVGRSDGAKVGMLIFLGAETMLFAGFVAAFVVFRLSAPVWPPPLQPLQGYEWTRLLYTLVYLA